MTTADPARALEEAVRVARASTHSRRLDSAVQAALHGVADALTAVVEYARARDAEIVELRTRVAAMESARPFRIVAVEARPFNLDP